MEVRKTMQERTKEVSYKPMVLAVCLLSVFEGPMLGLNLSSHRPSHAEDDHNHRRKSALPDIYVETPDLDRLSMP